MSQPRARQRKRKPACLPEQLWRSREPCSAPHSRSSVASAGPLEQGPHGDELLGPRLVRGAGDRQLLGRQVVRDERERLQRLRRGADESDEVRVAPGLDDRAVADDDGVRPVAGLDEIAPGHGYIDRVHEEEDYSRVSGGGGGAPGARRAACPLAGRQGRPGPHRHAEDVRPAALARSKDGAFAGARRRGKHLLFPTDDGELVLHVHLMSAGRIRFLEPGAKGPKSPAFRLRLEDGGELILTEGGPKKRARVGVYRPERARGRAGPPRSRGGWDHDRGADGDRAPRGAAPASVPPRPARARRHRAGLVERDPQPREALAVRAHDRALRRGARAPGGDDPRAARPRAWSCAWRARRTRRLTRFTTGSASRARTAERRSPASTSRSTRSSTAPSARRAGGSSRTAGSRGCLR